MADAKSVRYAVVGLGWIAREVVSTGEENKPVSLVPYEVGARPSGEQEMKLPPVKSKKIVHAAAPAAS